MDEANRKPATEMAPDDPQDYWKECVFLEEPPSDIEPFRKLLREYGNVPEAQVDASLRRAVSWAPADEIRNSPRLTRAKPDARLTRTQHRQLWDVVQYPCIGLRSFTDLRAFQGPRLEAATRRLLSADGGASNDALLDVGCCIGQVLRHLAHRGVPPSRLYGTDLHPEFIRVGNELFGDPDSGPAFAAGDLLADDGRLRDLDHRVTMMHAANLFHLFTRTQQVELGVRMVRFLRPGTTDALIFGLQVGSLRPREMDAMGRHYRHARCYVHDRQSFQELWDDIGLRTGTRWRVEAELTEPLAPRLSFLGDDERLMLFGVYQVAPPAVPVS
ncbi:Methyltransferase type 11 [Metarhizium album ARSEF 1941]|uniref:Methyltransferase type 11 n=1 Tax=Metarhizium album (strain ARSEF 1941) TaxID=1081103 RepID=A0A0B2WW53_METAS|nr:Methyltransferase type 11 [Metarhizium album ARSEF 1941]KHO00422.1 Methyltransferase type 11 [Metarhizium album ARSEF 1941]